MKIVAEDYCLGQLVIEKLHPDLEPLVIIDIIIFTWVGIEDDTAFQQS